jgi:hypothetical protein
MNWEAVGTIADPANHSVVALSLVSARGAITHDLVRPNIVFIIADYIDCGVTAMHSKPAAHQVVY